MADRPLAIDLFCGLGGWADGAIAEGYDVVGFDIERHDYGDGLRYPGHLVIQDVRTLHGAQFRAADLIVASPPCQFFSYTAMPWRRAKERAERTRNDPELLEKELELFNSCFRIQREASAAAGRHVPMVVENVRGAQPWIGPARWHHGSYYLWGDVPALMPMTVGGSRKAPGQNWSRYRDTGEVTAHWRMQGIKNSGGSWFRVAASTKRGRNPRDNPDYQAQPSHTPHMTNPAEHPPAGRAGGVKHRASGSAWFDSGPAAVGGSNRRAASALIAKIPLPLARHIAAVYRPGPEAAAGGRRDPRDRAPPPCHLLARRDTH